MFCGTSQSAGYCTLFIDLSLSGSEFFSRQDNITLCRVVFSILQGESFTILKGTYNESNFIFLWHKVDNMRKTLTSEFQLIPICISELCTICVLQIIIPIVFYIVNLTIIGFDNINHTIGDSTKINPYLQMSFRVSCFYDFVTKSDKIYKNLRFFKNLRFKN